MATVNRPAESAAIGLSGEEAAVRLRKHGPNELPTAKPKNIFRLALDVLREPMLLLLVATGGVYLVLGDLAEALALLAAIFVVVSITLFQEYKTERTLQALRDLSSPRALVIRDGVTVRVAGRDVVPGDVVLLGEGDRVPADAAVVSAENLRVDESLLTGESVPVAKTPLGGVAPVRNEAGRHALYSGTLVVAGHGIARVTATGATTELGQIGSSLSELAVSRTALQREVSRVVRLLAVLGFSACLMVAVVYGLAQRHWLDGALAGLTMAISMVPEEFPVILTIFLAFGAWRISSHRVLTRRLPAIETLGSTTVLCVDKTGTLTENRMAIATVMADGELHEVMSRSTSLPDHVRQVVECGVLASRQRATDPMERAFLAFVANRHIAEDDQARLIREYPLSDTLLAMTNVWRQPDGSTIVAVKGAPEAVADLCHLSARESETLFEHVQTMAGRGLRVLAVAHAQWMGGDLPATAREFSPAFLGLVGLADPVREGVPGAVRECAEAGIRVVMLTGDYPATALAIAAQVGLARTDVCLSGPELTRLDDAALRERARSVDVFARVVPRQKLRLVSALKANGEVVAMTGDGVNDAPALKAADVGIAMGSRGTDVAREAAALVLLDDDFASIVRAVRLGRQIYDNIRKAMSYVLAIHVPIAGISLIPVLFQWPLVLLPLHVVFMEMIVDPVCSIAFEREPPEPDLMRRPPRNPRQRLFEQTVVIRSLLQGFAALLIVLTVLVSARRVGLDPADVRTLTFTTLIATNLALIFTNRSLAQTFLRAWFAPNPVLWWLIAAAVLLLGLVLAVPVVRDLFQLARPHWNDLLACAIAATAAMFVMDGIKIIMGGKRR